MNDENTCITETAFKWKKKELKIWNGSWDQWERFFSQCILGVSQESENSLILLNSE